MSPQVPFTMTFVTDGDEVNGGTSADMGELAEAPGGTVGFKLDYQQLSC